MAAMMMSKANMMKVEPLAKSLRQKAEQLGFGTTIGAAQGVDEMPPELRFPLD
jgi:hypothetical protein